MKISMSIKVLTLFVFCLVVASCSKSDDIETKSNEVVSQTNILALLTDSDLENIVPEADLYIVANGYAWTDEMPSIEASGRFFDQSGNSMQVDEYKINDLIIPPVTESSNGSNRHRLYTSRISDTERMEVVKGFYGREVTFSARDDVFPNFSSSMYLPSLLYLDNYSTNGTVDKSENLTVTWNADPNNQNPVLIAVYYIPRNDNLNSQAVLVTKEVDDTGTYTIPYSDLQGFPTGGKAIVLVARGNQVITMLPGNDQEVLVNGLAYSITDELDIVD